MNWKKVGKISILSIPLSIIIMYAIDNFIVPGGLATVIGMPIPYYYLEYATKREFFSLPVLIIDFLFWYVALTILIYAIKRGKNEKR